MPTRLLTVLVLGTLLGLVACSPPIGVTRVGSRAVQRSLTASALSTGRASEWTRNTVNSWGLLERFEEDPEGALGALSFLHAEETKKKPHYLAAAVYTYAFLFPGKGQDRPGELDPRTRLAADLYNLAITNGFGSRDGRTVELAPGTYPLPFGEIAVWMNPGSLYWGDRRLVDFVPVPELAVRGMRNRYRLPGLGAPLAARAIPREDVNLDRSLIAPRARGAATALLRLYDIHEGIASGRLTGTLELYTASDAEEVALEGRTIPLEIEETGDHCCPVGGFPDLEARALGILRSRPDG
jgi:hypothetical protein